MQWMNPLGLAITGRAGALARNEREAGKESSNDIHSRMNIDKRWALLYSYPIQ